MTADVLSTDALRPRTRTATEAYLALGQHNRIAIGILRGDRALALGDTGGRYDMGSLSKTLTAHLVLSLAERGLLSLDMPISSYLALPEGSYPTVRALLSHTAGYGHLTPLGITLPGLLFGRYSRRNPYRRVGTDAVLRALSRRRKARAEYGYSDFGYAVLALAVEAVTSRPFAEVLTEFSRESLGLRRTGIRTEVELSPPATAWGRILPFWTWESKNPYLAAGGLTTDLSDMLTYLAVELQSNVPFILGAQSLVPGSESRDGRTATTLGWHTYPASSQLWQIGGVGTFRSALLFSRVRGIAVAVLGNARGARSANVRYIANMLYGDLKRGWLK